MGFSKGNYGNGARVAIARNVKRERHVATDNMVGSIIMFAGASTDIPTGWLLCDGSEMLQTSFPELYALIGTTYGSASRSGCFVLPDLQDKIAVGVGATFTPVGSDKVATRDTSTTDYNMTALYFIIRAY